MRWPYFADGVKIENKEEREEKLLDCSVASSYDHAQNLKFRFTENTFHDLCYLNKVDSFGLTCIKLSNVFSTLSICI